MEADGVIPDVIDEVPPSKLSVIYPGGVEVDSGKELTPTQINHWLVINIKGSDISSGDVIASYRGAGAPKGTGFHRYVFLVYEQKGKMTYDGPRESGTREFRINFSIRNFAKKYDLGKPLFGNFYNAQWDPYVDERRKLAGHKYKQHHNSSSKMETDGIAPGTVDEAPSAKISIIYPGNVEVKFGGELTPTQVKDQPEVKWDADPSKYYVLAMVDPDAPSREDPKFREVNHWLVVNVKGGDVSTGEVITEYRGSGPPKGTGLHRYIFLVFEQKEKLTFDEPKTASNSRAHRLNFSIRKFAKKYNLGSAFAGNFYKAQWDPYVDERNKHTVD
ncbi:hypothetical protein NQ318_003306 [Aromia moschata]|uniref:Uncharacterized protein n=1 Tax=Aromia moschata TaxID=1265417 RepID=A0AAV8YP84_9CUCU|nr:hypothetical protein NQ318_003306 [Aromia moschata]